MYVLPSISVTFDPKAFLIKGGLPLTLLKDRTGEFTPPGICCCASLKAAILLFKFIVLLFFISSPYYFKGMPILQILNNLLCMVGNNYIGTGTFQSGK